VRSDRTRTARGCSDSRGGRRCRRPRRHDTWARSSSRRAGPSTRPRAPIDRRRGVARGGPAADPRARVDEQSANGTRLQVNDTTRRQWSADVPGPPWEWQWSRGAADAGVFPDVLSRSRLVRRRPRQRIPTRASPGAVGARMVAVRCWPGADGRRASVRTDRQTLTGGTSAWGASRASYPRVVAATLTAGAVSSAPEHVARRTLAGHGRRWSIRVNAHGGCRIVTTRRACRRARR
jgi:hypothetical protein